MIPGIHASVSGGLDRALDALEELDLCCGQIFTSNQRQWKPRQPLDREIERYSARSAEIISHSSYLINPASVDRRIRSLSLSALGHELQRMHALGIRWTVLHPGAHMGIGEMRGLEMVSSLVREVLERSPEDVGILFENTAGQGTSIGSRFDQLADLLEMTGFPARTGICFDTCHAFAAGYDLSSIRAASDTIDGLIDAVGSERIGAFHLNDSLGECGSHRDRHASLGTGLIGLGPLRHIFSMDEFENLPGIVETPGSDMDRARDAGLLLREGQ